MILSHEDGQLPGAIFSQLKLGVVALFVALNKQITTFGPDVLATEFVISKRKVKNACGARSQTQCLDGMAVW